MIDKNESAFTEFIRDTLPEERPETTAPIKNAEKLWDWLLKNWREPAISARELYTCGPGFIRNDKEKALNLAEALAEQGRLIPQPTHRIDMRKWYIGGAQEK